jgi:ubiquinone/menaquinone biosynthesis C-methylase UbiE
MTLRRSAARELLDEHAQRSLAELHENLADMARYDRWLGAFDLMFRLATNDLPLSSVLSAFPTLGGLDVGSGSCDFIRFAQQRSNIYWVGLDASRDVLRVASPHNCRARVCGRGEWLPFADNSFGMVTCAHTLHHHDPAPAIALLRECARVARCRVVVIDLVRSYATLASAWLLTRLTSRNRMTRADGVQSVRRAYTADETLDLARQAGMGGARVKQHGLTHLSVVWRKSGANT